MIVIIKYPQEYWNGHQKQHNHWNSLTELTRLGLHEETFAQPGSWPYHRKGMTRTLVSCKLFATFCKEMHEKLAWRGWLGLARDTFVRDKFSPYKGALYKFHPRLPCSQTSKAFCLLFCGKNGHGLTKESFNHLLIFLKIMRFLSKTLRDELTYVGR